MAWADIESAFEWYIPGTSAWGNQNPQDVNSSVSASDQSEIKLALEAAYLAAPEDLQLMLDIWVQIVGQTIKVAGSTDDWPGYAIKDVSEADRYIALNVDRLKLLTTIGTDGQVAKIPLGVAVFHELVHMVFQTEDVAFNNDPELDQALQNTANYDNVGDTLREEQRIMEALGKGDEARVSYNAAMVVDTTIAPSPFKPLGESYTEFNAVDIVRLGDQKQTPSHALIPTDTLSTELRTDGSKDLILGFTGNDIIASGAGDDYLYGGLGADVFRPGSGNDYVYGDEVIATSTNQIDTVDYSTGDLGEAPSYGITVQMDWESGTLVDGHRQFDVTDGWGGSDRLISIEKITGTTHSDVFVFKGAAADNITIDSNSGFDSIDLSGSSTGYSLTLNAAGDGSLSVEGAQYHVTLENFTSISVGGSSHNDTFDVAGSSVIISGGDGDDTFTLHNLSASIFGGAGQDHLDLTGLTTAVKMSADGYVAERGIGGILNHLTANEVEEITGTSFNDVFYTDGSVVKIVAGAGDDLIKSASSSVEIHAGAGNDRIIMNTGQTANGATGNDIFDLANAANATIQIGNDSGHDVIKNWSGLTLDFGSLSASSISFGWDPQALSESPDPVYDGLWRIIYYQGLADIRTPTGIISLDGLVFNGFSVAKGFEDSHDTTGDPFGPYGGVGADLSLAQGLSFKFADGTYTLDELLIASGAEAYDTGTYTGDWWDDGAEVDYMNAPVAVEGFQSGVQDVSNVSVDWAANFFGGTPISSASSGSPELTNTPGNDIFVGSSGQTTVSYHSSVAGITANLRDPDRQDTGAGEDVYVEITGIIGSDFDDNLTASETGSSLTGGAGNDVLTGSAKSDLLEGGDGADVIVSGGGDDLINGGAGDDQIVLADGSYQVDGGEGTDIVTLSGSSDDYAYTRNSDGEISIVTIEGDPSDLEYSLLNVEQLHFDETNSTVAIDVLVGSYGTEGDDAWIAGTSGDDNLYGLAGDDTLYDGGGGNDAFYGGEGYDQVNFSGHLADYTLSRNEDGNISAVDATGHYSYLENVEALYFEGSANWRSIEQVVGEYGTDDDDAWIAGTDGNDNLYGLLGNDTFFGGSGDDLIVGGDGGNAEDQANYDGALANFTFARTEDGSVVVTDTVGDEGSDTLVDITAVYFDASANWRALIDLVADYGTYGDDAWIEGTDGGDNLFGLAGDDLLVGRDGNDFIYGGDGYDQANYFGNLSNYTIVRNADNSIAITDASGTEGSDLLFDMEAAYFSGSDDWLDLSTIRHEVYGTSSADLVMGTDINENLHGLGGNDVLIGVGGNDLLDGGDGIDEARYDGSLADYSFTQNSDSTVTVTNLAGPDGRDILLGVENLHFIDGNVSISVTDAVTTGGLYQEQYGTEYNDSMYGTDYNDKLYGLNDDDHFYGGRGNDKIYGGDGNDFASYDGTPTDYIIIQNVNGTVTITDKNGGEGQDTLDSIENLDFSSNNARLTIAQAITISNGGNLEFTGSSSFDDIHGTSYNDTMYGLAGWDTFFGGAGDDLIFGGADTDTASYLGSVYDFQIIQNTDGTVTVADPENGQGTDTLDSVEYLDFAYESYSFKIADAILLSSGAGLDHTGTSASETVDGSEWNDNVYGLAGDDTLYGMTGDDRLHGGDGVDTAYYKETPEDYTFVLNPDGTVTISDGEFGFWGTDTVYDDVELLYFEGSDITISVEDALEAYGSSEETQSRTFKANVFSAAGEEDAAHHRIAPPMIVQHEYIADFLHA